MAVMTDDQWKRNPWDNDPTSGGQDSSPAPDDGQSQGDDDNAVDQTTIRPRTDWEPTESHQSDQPAPESSPSTDQQPSWQTDQTTALGVGYGAPQPQPGQWSPSTQPSAPQPQGYPASASQPSAPQYPGQQYPAQPSQSYPGGQQYQGQPAAGQYPPAGQYPQGGWGGEPPAGGYSPAGMNQPPMNQPAGPKMPGFLANLFDLTFTRFVTPTIVKVVYILIIAAAVVWYLGMIIGAFSTGSTPVGVAALVLGWIPALLAIALSRLQLEYIIALIRTSEYTRDLRDRFAKGDDTPQE
ncbi:Uncharacterised protein [Acidipropionibacterium jensenii]|uniref:DUF4282 domain-containing protein n=6 Tax=Acidipropionibacterium jensenii TaxID=1749 RepID=A0A448P0D1_9ACTN|nr:Uncharacterised protein [Acidipropionibacterium jensenii]